MDGNERQVIDGLFAKLREVDRQSPQRDGAAEAHIARMVSAMPSAPYYMAQAILVQEQALANMQNRVQELERAAAERPAGGSFLGGLFGGGAPAAQAPRRGMAPMAQGPIPPQYMQPGTGAAGSPWGRPAGGGFLAGAMQTALGVAGGMLIADALMGAFDGGAAEAGELAQDAGLVEEPGHEPIAHEEPAYDDGGMGGDEGFEI
jgi:hypothetical protein